MEDYKYQRVLGAAILMVTLSVDSSILFYAYKKIGFGLSHLPAYLFMILPSIPALFYAVRQFKTPEEQEPK